MSATWKSAADSNRRQLYVDLSHGREWARVYELFLVNRVAWVEGKGSDALREKRAKEQGVKTRVHATEVEKPKAGEAEES